MGKVIQLMLLMTACASAQTVSYWFQNWQRSPDAQSAANYFMYAGTNISLTYSNNHVVINSGGGGGGGGNLQLFGDITSPLTALPNVTTTLKATGTAGTYVKTTFDAQGRETSGSATLDLATDVTGDLDVTHLNGGTGAGIGTFWRGDGTWGTPAGGSQSPWTGDEDAAGYGLTNLFQIGMQTNGLGGSIFILSDPITAGNLPLFVIDDPNNTYAITMNGLSGVSISEPSSGQTLLSALIDWAAGPIVSGASLFMADPLTGTRVFDSETLSASPNNTGNVFINCPISGLTAIQITDDGTGVPVLSSTASGGIYFYSSPSDAWFDSNVHGTLFIPSDANLKANIVAMTNSMDVIRSLPIYKWNWKATVTTNTANVRRSGKRKWFSKNITTATNTIVTVRTNRLDNLTHYGPMAQDWKSAVGGNGKEISVQDEIGILLAAVKELDARVRVLESNTNR